MTSLNDRFFVVLEGLDGAGKSVVAQQLHDVLAKMDLAVKLTYEPHNSSFAGEFNRDVLAKRIQTDPYTMALSFAANRADHNARIIRPFLDDGGGGKRVLICDRYYLSSLVYQSTDNISMTDVMFVNQWAQKPDVILFLNVRSEIAYFRMDKRNQERELFETKLDDIRAKYENAIAFLRDRDHQIVEVDANQSIEHVLHYSLQAIQNAAPGWLAQRISNYFKPD